MPQGEDKESRTEQATGKKIGDARGKGQVAKSQEVVSAAMIFTSMVVMYLFSGWLFSHVKESLIYVISSCGTFTITDSSIRFLFLKLLAESALAIVPILGILGLAAFLSIYLQIGWLISWEPIKPKFDKLIPNMAAIKNIFFSLNSLVELGKSLAKLIVIGYISYVVISGNLKEINHLIHLSIQEIADYLGDGILMLIYKMIWFFLLIAIIDYIYQNWKHKDDLKMTKEEVKDEKKQQDGDPKIKKEIRKKQFQMALKWLIQDVPESDVIITNPDHFAIAVSYKPGEMGAPKVMAKGKNHMAQRIKEIAKENNIPIVENKPLARMLYKSVEVGEEIPETLFKAVAEVLAYVYKLKNRLGEISNKIKR